MLAGGRSSRMGGGQKASIEIEGRRLIDIVVDGAFESGAREVVIAGDIESDRAVNVRETPPFGGPVAGLSAAIPQIKDEWLMLLACDLPHTKLLGRLLTGSFREIGADIDGLVALRDGRVQWLAGIYRRSSLDQALAASPEVSGVSVRALLKDLKLREVQDPEGLSRDLDTPEELARFLDEREEHG